MPDDNKTTDTNPAPPQDTPGVVQTIPPMEPSISTPSPPPVSPTDQGQKADTPPPAADSTVPPPPPIIEEQKKGEADLPPVVATGKKPKGKVSKKVIATILGILFLVGGVSAGVILVQRQQEIRERAAEEEVHVPPPEGTCESSGHTDCSTACPDTNCSSRYVKDHITREFCNDDGYWCQEWKYDLGIPCGCDGSGWPNHGRDYWLDVSDYELRNECGSQRDPRCVTGEAPTPTPTPTPTLPPGISASCIELKMFDTDWNQITDFSTLEAGDVVRFTVCGTTTSGTIDKARFRINSPTWRPAVTQKRPGVDEFYDEYTIPEGVTSFTINAQLHHTDPDIGWF